MIRLQNKKFFERFYINKQNVVQASHIKLMSDEQKRTRYPETETKRYLNRYNKIFYNEEFDPGSG